MPGYGAYLQLGVIVSLAWALPDKPTYPNVELMEQYENASLKYRNDLNVTESLNPKGESNRNSTGKRNQTLDNFENYAWHYYKYLQNRQKTDSFYFGNLKQTKVNRDDNHCNGNVNNKCHFIPSSTYNGSNDFDAFSNYMIETYFKPWFESDFYKATLT